MANQRPKTVQNTSGFQLERVAPAKINLGLHVLRKRPDGYHDLETVFLRIPWHDHLSVQPAAALSLTCSDPALPTDDTNLCLKAARLLAETCGVATGAALHLDKHIPYGAGLGGGSSDAAATLQLLAAHWHLSLPDGLLHALAARLGSDVPFFLGPPTALGTGRGEVLTPFDYHFPFALVVAVPPVHVATALAYRLVRPHDTNRPDLRELVGSNDLARWRTTLVNDFEQPVFSAFPALGTVKTRLLHLGAAYAALSGSGSAVFGVFEDPHQARQAAHHPDWQQAGYRVRAFAPEAFPVTPPA